MYAVDDYFYIFLLYTVDYYTTRKGKKSTIYGVQNSRQSTLFLFLGNSFLHSLKSFRRLLSLYFLGGESFLLHSAKISPPKPRSFFRLQSLSRASSPQKIFLHRTALSAPPIFPLSYRKSLLRRRTLFKEPCAPRLFRENFSRPIKAFLRPPRSLFSADKLWLPLHYPIDVSPLSPRENISFTHRNALCPPLSASQRCFFG